MRLRNALFALIIVLLWASTTVIGRFLVGIEPTISAVQLAFYRYVTGFLTLVVIYQVTKPVIMRQASNVLENPKRTIVISSSEWASYLLTGITLGLFPLLLFESVKYTSATAASFLLNANTIFIAPLSVAFLKDRLPKMQAIGILIATTGILVLLVGIDPITNWLTSETFLGNMLALAAGMTWAGYTVMSKKLFSDHSPLRTTVIQLGVASIFLFFVVILAEHSLLILSIDTWLLIFIIGPGATGLGFWLYFMILDEETATTTGSIQYLVPIFSLFYEWIFLDTLISLVAIVGGLLTLVGLGIADYWKEFQQVFRRKPQDNVLGARK